MNVCNISFLCDDAVVQQRFIAYKQAATTSMAGSCAIDFQTESVLALNKKLKVNGNFKFFLGPDHVQLTKVNWRLKVNWKIFQEKNSKIFPIDFIDIFNKFAAIKQF